MNEEDLWITLYSKDGGCFFDGNINHFKDAYFDNADVFSIIDFAESEGLGFVLTTVKDFNKVEVVPFVWEKNGLKKMEDKKQLAFIKDGIHIGMRDCGKPVMWFGVHFDGCGSLIVMDLETATKHIKELDAYDITEIGKSSTSAVLCEIEVVDNIVKFVRFVTE